MPEHSALILIVDDDQNIVKYISALMAREGFKTLQAYDGKTALKLLRSEKADVMILDIKLPDMDGMQVLRQTKDLDRNLPIIVITGLSEIRGSVAAIKAGAFEYLGKPFDRVELVRVVNQAVAERKLRREVKEPSTQDLLSTLGSEVEETGKDTSRVQSFHNLDNWVRRLSGTEMPVLGGTARNIASIAESEKGNCPQMACAILEDAFMTSRVLKVANSAYYSAGRGGSSHRSSGQNINTVSQAVVRLGFDTVRTLCQSLSLVEGLVKGGKQKRLEEGMADAFHAAVQAKWVAINQKDSSAEEVFIATLLYNLGDMVFWCFADKEQAQKMEATMQTPSDSNAGAEMKTLGFSLKELTARLSKEWRLGSLLQEALDESKPMNPRTENIVLSHKLAQAVKQGWDTQEVRELTKQMAGLLRLPEEEVTQRIHTNAKEATRTAANWGAAAASRLIPLPRENPEESLVSVVNEEEPQPEEARFFQTDQMLQLRILRELSAMFIDRKPDYNLFISSKIVSGVKRSGIPDTIKMSEAAGRKLWGFNKATSLF